jgi:hypothetical protein
MTRARKFPPLDDFCVRFPRVLQSQYSATRAIVQICQDEALKKECATLLWHCVNDCAERLDKIAGKQFRKRAKAAVEKALAAIPAFEFVYTRLDTKAHLAEYMGTLKADLLEKQRLLASAPPPLDYGRNLDWGIVEYAQQNLSRLLGAEVSAVTMADLLSAAFDVCGWKKKEITEDGVRHGLARFRERRLARHTKITPTR